MVLGLETAIMSLRFLAPCQQRLQTYWADVILAVRSGLHTSVLGWSSRFGRHSALPESDVHPIWLQPAQQVFDHKREHSALSG